MPQSRHAVEFAWLLKLRWGAILGQTLIFLLVTLALRIELASLPFLGVILLTITSNLFLRLSQRTLLHHYHWATGCTLVLDIFLLTALLYFYGGSANPLSMMYLVHVTLAAMLLNIRWTWFLIALSSLCFTSLFFYSVPVQELSMHHAHHHEEPFSLHLQGMLLAFFLISTLLGYFLTRIKSALEAREHDVARLQQRRSHEQRLAALAALAAGAAHELNTPLGTIAIAAHELSRELAKNSPESPYREDVQLITQQVERCGEIIQNMSTHSGKQLGEMPASYSVQNIFAEVHSRFKESDQKQIVFQNASEENQITIPKHALLSSLHALIKNAIEASGANQAVDVKFETTDELLNFIVRDTGSGMSEETLEHLGEPFFTLKTPGAGLGLGVFLVQLFASQVGGTLSFHSRPGTGTTATLSIPKNIV